MAVITRVFMNGNSQAVRIPQEFRLESSRVEICRNERGELVLKPVDERRGTALLQVLDGFDAEFVTALVEDRAASGSMQDREAL